MKQTQITLVSSTPGIDFNLTNGEPAQDSWSTPRRNLRFSDGTLNRSFVSSAYASPSFLLPTTCLGCSPVALIASSGTSSGLT